MSVANHDAEKPKEESERNAWPDFWFTVSTNLPAISHVVIKDWIVIQATYRVHFSFGNFLSGYCLVCLWPTQYHLSKPVTIFVWKNKRDERYTDTSTYPKEALNHNIQVRIFCF